MQLTIGKIPVRIHPLFLGLIAAIGWMSSQSLQHTIVWAAVITLSVLVHEFGHALTALKFGQTVMVELFGLGGVTYRKGPPLKAWQNFVIVMNGPLAGFSLFAVAYLFRKFLGYQPSNLFLYALDVTMLVNLFWTLVNLLPVYPLDGGHLFRILMEGMFGFKGVKVALFLSTLFGLGLGIFFFYTNFWVAGALFFMFTFESFQGFQKTMGLTKADQSAEVQQLFKKGEREHRSGNIEQALIHFTQVREETKKGVFFLAASEAMAQVYAQTGRFQEAYDLLSPLSAKISPGALGLFHQVLFKLGKWKEAIQIGNRTFQSRPNYKTAVVNSLCHAVLGDVQPAVGWLQTALNEGLPNLDEVLSKHEYDLIRNHPGLQGLKSA